MKDDSSGEKIVLTLVSVIIIIVIAYVIYTIFTSNKNFYTNDNTNEKNNTIDYVEQTEQQQNNNSNTVNTDNMNIDTSTVQNTKKTIETEMATFTSTLYDKDENRVYNIGLAIEKLNGTIVKKDEEFSFNNTIGPMDEAHGYKEAVRI